MNTTFTIILHAGNAKAYAMEAITQARTGQYKQAELTLKQAEVELVEASRLQHNLLLTELEGNKETLDLLMIHAQDHLTGAGIMTDLAQEFMMMYQLLAQCVKKEKFQ